MSDRLKDMDELPKWWDMGLNLITGLRPEPQESNSLAEKRYYHQSENFTNKISE